MDPGGAVVEDGNVAGGEEVMRQEFAQRDILRLAVVIERENQVAYVAVEYELVEGLCKIFTCKLFAPFRIMCRIAFQR